MEQLVSIYNSKLEHDNKNDGIRLFIYKDKNDFIEKYIEENLMKMKIKEPNNNEKYEDTFKKFLTDIRMICEPFDSSQMIIVGVYGKYVDKIDIGNSDVRVYGIDDFELLVDDLESYYS